MLKRIDPLLSADVLHALRAMGHGDDLVIWGPGGERFLTFLQVAENALREKQRAEQEKQRAEQMQRENDRLRAALRAVGIDPDRLHS